jgi:hypothetical protein
MHNRRTIRSTLAAFKGNIYQKHIHKNFYNFKGATKQQKCFVNDTTCTIFAFENRSYLGEFEAELKKALALGAQGILFDEKKTEGRKPHDTVPLKSGSSVCKNYF